MRFLTTVLFISFSALAYANPVASDFLPKGVIINAGSGGHDEAVLVGIEAIGRHVVRASYIEISYFGKAGVDEYPFEKGTSDEEGKGTPVRNYYINCKNRTYSDSPEGKDRWAWKKYIEGMAKPWSDTPEYGETKDRFPMQFQKLCHLTKNW